MLLQITSIEFDFTCDDPDDYVSEEYKESVTAEALGQTWEVDSEDDLADEVSDAYGWCLLSVDYRVCLQ
jgi:hypothetical protein